MSEQRKNVWLRMFGWLFLGLIALSVFWSLIRDGVWHDNMGLNLLVVGDSSMGVLVLRPEEEMGSWIVLPSDLMIGISGSAAKYPVSSVWEFGLGERRAFDICKDSLGDELGVIFPRMIKVNGAATAEEVLSEVLSLTAKTDLSLMDRLSIRKYLYKIMTAKRLLEISIPNQVYKTTIDPDGKEFREFTQVVNAWSKDKFLFDRILSEDVEMVVNNLSGVVGAGLIFARQAETAGIKVIEVKNDINDRVDGKGCVYQSNESLFATERLLKNHFNCKALYKDGGVESGEVRVWLL